MSKVWEDNLVSIIMPLYNGERYLRESIESVLAQTYARWELLVVNDCSTDSSAKILDRYCEKDARIRRIDLAENSGAAIARNTAIHQARGRYLAFLDCDDLWHMDKLQKQLKTMYECKVGFVFSSCGVIDAEGKLVKDARKVPQCVSYEELLDGNCIPCVTVLIDRKQYSDVEMPLIHHEDYATWLMLLKVGGTAVGLQEVLAYYRETGKSLSGNKLRAAGWTFHIYRDFLKLSFFQSVGHFIRYSIKAVTKRL